NGATALMLASGSGHVESVERLLNHGADVKAEDHNRRTARGYAVSSGHTKVAEMLQKHETHKA
ncbi:MAG: hypothetical protein C3F08_11220, partial [Candidatus Methylomirabilota bacterium]